MIRTKKELSFYLKADRMMRSGTFRPSFKKRLLNLLSPEPIMSYMRASRKYVYHSHQGGLHKLAALYHGAKRRRLGVKLGFTISFDQIGYGLLIPHYGTIVFGGGNRLGNYAVLHTSTCVTAGKKQIGDGFYLSSGAKVVRDITIGNNVSVAANSVVNRDIPDNTLVAGMPAEKKKDAAAWYERDSQEYVRRVHECEKLRKQYQLAD